jgi:exonuclease SbcD
MKILITSDWHVDTTTAGVERLPEIKEYVEELIEVVRAERVDLVLNLGDSWDPGSMADARWARFVYDAFVRIAKAAPLGLVAIPGNHDVIDTSTPTSTLSPFVAAEGSEMVKIVERPKFFIRGGVGFLALPYVSRTFERTDDFRDEFEEAFKLARRDRRAPGAPALVVFGHLSFEGMHPGSESTDMAHGREILFPVEAVKALEPTLVANGHYHARQTIRRGDLDIEIPGAPIRFTFGEVEDGPRGFLIAEV